MIKSNSRILVLYSSPSKPSRLRLDIEHRAVEQVLRELHVNPSLVNRLHATTTEDLTNALLEENYEIVQFSGHGNQEGFLLEDLTLGEKGIFVSAKEIANILHEISPQLKVAIFLSCYSAESIPVLVKAAPFVITVHEAADDSAAIDFIAQFYNTYLRTGSIERAFNVADRYIKLIKKDSVLIPLLSRRALEKKSEDQILYQAFPSGKDDSILIDLTEAENDIKSLGVARDIFLGVLSRKIRVHRWIFSTPREKVVLPLGPYFGLFSWADANDVVTCHRIFKVKESIEEETCEAWASLIVVYNNHYADPYRNQQNVNNKFLEIALKEYKKAYDPFFNTGDNAKLLRKVSPIQFKLTKSAVSSNLDMADNKFHYEDYDSVVIYLETVLSAIHDLLDNLTTVLTS